MGVLLGYKSHSPFFVHVFPNSLCSCSCLPLFLAAGGVVGFAKFHNYCNYSCFCSYCNCRYFYLGVNLLLKLLLWQASHQLGRKFFLYWVRLFCQEHAAHSCRQTQSPRTSDCWGLLLSVDSQLIAVDRYPQNQKTELWLLLSVDSHLLAVDTYCPDLGIGFAKFHNYCNYFCFCSCCDCRYFYLGVNLLLKLLSWLASHQLGRKFFLYWVRLFCQEHVRAQLLSKVIQMGVKLKGIMDMTALERLITAMEMLRQDIELYAQAQREAHLLIKEEVLNLTAGALMAGNPLGGPSLVEIPFFVRRDGQPSKGVVLAPSSGPDAVQAAGRGRSSSIARRRSRSRGPIEVASTLKTWASLFSTPSSGESNHALSFIEPILAEDQKIAVCDIEDLEELHGAWDRTIVGYVVDLKTSYMPLSSFIKSRWGVVGFDLHLLENGFFLCKLDSEEDVTRILEGFWSIRGHPMILRRWEQGLKMELESLKNILVWISIHSLLIHLWSKKFISKLCSKVGEPLFMDRLTTKRRLSYARACVMVSFEVDLPDTISYKDLNGSLHLLHISYSRKPRRCGSCGLFGHFHGQCQNNSNFGLKNKVQQIYKRKEHSEISINISNEVISSKVSSQQRESIEPNRFSILNTLANEDMVEEGQIVHEGKEAGSCNEGNDGKKDAIIWNHNGASRMGEEAHWREVQDAMNNLAQSLEQVVPVSLAWFRGFPTTPHVGLRANMHGSLGVYIRSSSAHRADLPTSHSSVFLLLRLLSCCCSTGGVAAGAVGAAAITLGLFIPPLGDYKYFVYMSVDDGVFVPPSDVTWQSIAPDLLKTEMLSLSKTETRSVGASWRPLSPSGIDSTERRQNWAWHTPPLMFARTKGLRALSFIWLRLLLPLISRELGTFSGVLTLSPPLRERKLVGSRDCRDMLVPRHDQLASVKPNAHIPDNNSLVRKMVFIEKTQPWILQGLMSFVLSPPLEERKLVEGRICGDVLVPRHERLASIEPDVQVYDKDSLARVNDGLPELCALAALMLPPLYGDGYVEDCVHQENSAFGFSKA
ncbi:hypothetical protein Taro_051328 [Colocasia esculenta]|uniref:DUF4283 domain-containing protein n=1 Tax=Colocasia esculenta TaxID=4460 RepID=A0A843XFT4_COLES|nr:hypothetical protein [Colocasia esculenta]